MNGNIAIVAALPGELKPLLRHAAGVPWTRLRSDPGTWVWEYRHPGGCWRAACAGMGRTRAVLAYVAAARDLEPDVVSSVGWAGALNSSLHAGDTRSIALVIDTRTGERFPTADAEPDWPRLATTEYVADKTEKTRLNATYGASLVDMEAATVARLAASHGLPFHCLKAVSDGAEAPLPDFTPFIGQDGQIRMTRFILHSAVRPASWPALLRLGQNSSLAANRLADAIYHWIDADSSIRDAAKNLQK